MNLFEKEVTEIQRASDSLQMGGVIVYPTESMYGLGCDPFNALAVNKLLNIKNRSSDLGLILIISNWNQLTDLILPISDIKRQRIDKTWPGNHTWLFQKSNMIPNNISGNFKTVAIRMTNNLVARKLCDSFGRAIVSTSANLHGMPPCRDLQFLSTSIVKDVDLILSLDIGNELQASTISDLETLKKYR